MLKRSIIFWILANVVVVKAQTAAPDSIDLSHLMKNQPAHWWDVSFGCSELVPTYFDSGELDSLLLILQYWEEHTSYYEPVRRMWMLFQIHNHSFDPDFISQSVVEDMYAYQSRVQNQKDSTDWYLWSDDKSTAMISKRFNTFTQQLATDLLHYDDLSDDEWLLCLFYSNNFEDFWASFENGEVSQSVLYRRFRQEFRQSTLLNMHFEVFGGWYSPRKSLTALGGKLVVGGSIGLDFERLLIDGTLAFRLLNPDEPYKVGYKNELFETSHYMGVYFAVEPAFNLYNLGPVKIDLLSGVALDIIEAISMEENPYEEESIDLFAANLNLGVGARFFVWRTKPYYIRCQLRYEFAGYNTHGGTDLSSGEAMTLRLGFGWDENSRKREQEKYFKNP